MDTEVLKEDVVEDKENVSKDGNTKDNQDIKETDMTPTADVGQNVATTPADVRSKTTESTENSQNQPGNVEKLQEQKLLSKFPSLGNKQPQSKMLQKRLSKGRMFFDSGDYNMTKTNAAERPANKKVSTVPQRIAPDSSGESDHHDESDDELDPSRQAVPTPDLLFMRRAAKHMPMGSAGPRNMRRSTMAPQAPGGGFTAISGLPQGQVDELISDGPVCNPNVLARRRATLQVRSKLA